MPFKPPAGAVARIETNDDRLLFWLCSNPKGSVLTGFRIIELAKPHWPVPAWWPVVEDHVADEAVRPFTPAQRDLLVRVARKAAEPRPFLRSERVRKPPPRPYA